MVRMKYGKKDVLEIVNSIVIIDFSLVLHFKAYVMFTEEFYLNFWNSLSQTDYSAFKVRKIPKVVCVLAVVILTVLRQKHFI